MNERLDNVLVGIAVGLALTFAGTILFAMGSAFVAFGWWMLRLAGLAV